MNSKTKYPDQEIPKEILESIKEGHLVVFVGAGVSKIIGGPTWGELACKHLEYLLTKEAITYSQKEILISKYVSDPRRLLTLCDQLEKSKNLERFNFPEALKFDPEKCKRYPIYEELYKWGAIYVTTNYDAGFDEAIKESIFEKRGNDNSRPLSKDDFIHYEVESFLNANLDQGRILHLHGSVKEPASMVVTLNDYIERYDKESDFQKFLKELFEKFTALFIGYGVSELEILEYLIRKAGIGAQHFILMPSLESEREVWPIESDYFDAIGLKVLRYEIDKMGHPQLLQYLQKNWTPTLTAMAQQRPLYDKMVLLDKALKDKAILDPNVYELLKLK